MQYFLQGLIIIAPITITLWAVISLFTYIDSILPNLLHSLFPASFKVDAEGKADIPPGLGFIIVIGILVLVGWVSSYFIVGRLLSFFDRVLERTPGIKLIYSSVKDFLEAFAGNKRKFDKPVLVNVDGHDVWRMGFMTKADCAIMGMSGHAVVYVPHSYALSGIVYIVPVEKVKLLPRVSSADAMKFAVSGGIAHITEIHH